MRGDKMEHNHPVVEGSGFGKGYDNPVYCDPCDDGVSPEPRLSVGTSNRKSQTLQTLGDVRSTSVSESSKDPSLFVSVDISGALDDESKKTLSRTDKIPSHARRVKELITGTNFLVYCSHFLSAWGDRMWAFGVSLFLIDISPDSLQLTASYGLAMGISVLLLGALIGDWVDNTPRLKAAQLSLVLQNLFVVLCAGVVFAHITYREVVKEMWDGWLEKLSFVLIITLAIASNLFSVARVIAVERDWIVEICGKDRDMLANVTATLRRIDLATKILAPIATGQIMYFAELRIGAVFIGGWNVVTVFLEYYLIWKVYNTVPALMKKKDWTRADKEKALEVIEAEEVPVVLETVGKGGLTDYELEVLPEGEKVSIEESADSDGEDKTKQTSPDVADGQVLRKDNSESEPGITVEADADEKQEVEEKQTCCGRCLQKIFSSFVILFTGWKTYMQYDVARAGLGLACLYMTVLGFDNITTGYAYNQGISEAILGVFQGAGAVIGIIGTLAYPALRRCVGLERTGLFALAAQISCLSLCVVAVFMPGSPFEPDYFLKDHAQSNTSLLNCTPPATTPSILDVSMATAVPMELGVSVPMVVNPGDNVTVAMSTPSVSDCPVDTPQSSYFSIALLMAGIISARFGLWVADLTITQLFLENVEERERGKVNGVQSSLNKLMDMFKFALVVALPQPQVFGYLVVLSFIFICIGFALYASYSRQVRGHILPFHKHCANTAEESNHVVAA